MATWNWNSGRNIRIIYSEKLSNMQRNIVATHEFKIPFLNIECRKRVSIIVTK